MPPGRGESMKLEDIRDIEVMRYAEKRARDAALCFLKHWGESKCEHCLWLHLCEELAIVFGKKR